MHFDLGEQTRKRLEVVQAKTHAQSYTEVLRRALSTYDYFVEKRAEGKTIIIRDPDGTEREVEFL